MSTADQNTAQARVVEVDPRQDPRWDRFVRSRPDATVYHLSAWAKILHAAYGGRPRYLAVSTAEGDRLDGVLPLMSTRGVITGRRLRSLPVVNAAGPLALGHGAATALLSTACDIAQRERRMLDIRSRSAGLDALDDRLSSVPKYPNWVAPVPPPDQLDLGSWKKHSRNLYRSVKKAQVAGLNFREARGAIDLRRWYRLYLATMRKRRTLPRPWRHLEMTRRLLEPSGDFRLFVVEAGDRMVAGVVTHPFGDAVELVYNGSDPDSLELRPNHLLNWGVLGWASEHGHTLLDLGEAAEGGPLSRFKAQFGAEPVLDYRYDYGTVAASGLDKRARAASSELEQPDAEGLLTRAWSHAPLAATRAAAAVAYRFA
jgi:CelD/BcsL family acetyltransferase involved in cellulose biosynthesis